MSKEDRRSERVRAGSADGDNPFAALIEQVRAGSKAAADTLYKNHSADVLAAIHDLLGPKDPLRCREDSSDLAQDAWLSAFEALKGSEAFADEREFERFLKKIARNCVGMSRRTANAEKRSHAREEPLAGRDAPAKVPGPAELAAATDEWDLFLAELSPRDRFIVAHVFDGYRLPEIAVGMRLDLRLVQRVVQDAKWRWMEREMLRQHHSCR
jgi:RNA polymerase sigma factor (sigma-70 family)